MKTYILIILLFIVSAPLTAHAVAHVSATPCAFCPPYKVRVAETEGVEMEKGDRVNYSGHLSGGQPQSGCVIESVDYTGVMFNQPMATLVGVDHWVSIQELTLCTDGEDGS